MGNADDIKSEAARAMAIAASFQWYDHFLCVLELSVTFLCVSLIVRVGYLARRLRTRVISAAGWKNHCF